MVGKKGESVKKEWREREEKGRGSPRVERFFLHLEGLDRGKKDLKTT